MAVFVTIQANRREPLMRLSILRTPNLAAANVAQLLLGAAWIPMWFFLNLYLQQVLGYGAFEGGAALLPMTVAIMFLMVVVAPRVINRIGFKAPIVAGMLLLAAGMAVLSLVRPDGSFAVDVLPASLIAATGMALAFIPSLGTAISSAKPEEGGLASGIVNTSYQVGSALGLAVMTALASAQGADQLGDPGALTDGYSAASLGAAGIAVVGALLAAALLRTRSVGPPRRPTPRSTRRSPPDTTNAGGGSSRRRRLTSAGGTRQARAWFLRILWCVRPLAAMFVLAAVLAACGDDQNEARPADVADPGIVHVHGLGRNPADGSLMVATHTGLFRATGELEDPVRVAGRYQDTMGFTVVGPDHFLGSGHPASLREDPAFLGLIESRDAGKQWRPISLRGEVDFHVLEAQDEIVYGFGSDFETREARFLASEDAGRSWERLSPPEPLIGLAIDPRDPRHIVALGEESGYVSRDGGSTWRPIGVPGGLVTWTPEIGLVAADLDGVIRRASDPMGEWEVAGSLDGSPAALEGVGDELLAATHEARVLSSRDGGKSWEEILRP